MQTFEDAVIASRFRLTEAEYIRTPGGGFHALGVDFYFCGGVWFDAYQGFRVCSGSGSVREESSDRTELEAHRRRNHFLRGLVVWRAPVVLRVCCCRFGRAVCSLSKTPPLAGMICHGRGLFLCRLRPFSHRQRGRGTGARRLEPEQSWLITRILISRGEGGIRASGHVCVSSI